MSTLNLVLGLWNGPTMMGAYFERALRKNNQIITIGPEFENAKSDFNVRPGEQLRNVLDQISIPIDFYVQFYSKPDYFPPDLHAIQIPKAWYVYDLHLHLDEIAASSYLFDVIFTYDELSKVELLKKGVPRVEVLPFAADPDLYFQRFKGKKCKYEIGFSGSAWGSETLKNREQLLQRIGGKFNLKVEHRTLSGKAVAEFYQNCQIVLNHAIKNDINMRIPEVLLSGRPLLTPDVPGLNEMIDLQKHAIVYNNENILDKIEYMLSHQDEMEIMALNGQNFALEKLCYQHRADALCRFLNLELEFYKHHGRPIKNDYLAKAAQFNYHLFRYPGDALIWLQNQIRLKKTRIYVIFFYILSLLILSLKIFQKIKKVEYFQKYR